MSHTSFYSIVAVALRHVVSPLDWSASPPQVVSCTQRLSHTAPHQSSYASCLRSFIKVYRTVASRYRIDSSMPLPTISFQIPMRIIVIFIIALFVCFVYLRALRPRAGFDPAAALDGDFSSNLSFDPGAIAGDIRQKGRAALPCRPLRRFVSPSTASEIEGFSGRTRRSKEDLGAG